MGYFTQFELQAKRLTPDPLVDVMGEPGPDVGVFAQWLADHRTEGYDPFEESCKWYTHEDDMVALSQAFPGVLFTLTGEGEEAGDLWRKYFLNGRKQIAKAKIEYDEPTL